MYTTLSKVEWANEKGFYLNLGQHVSLKTVWYGSEAEACSNLTERRVLKESLSSSTISTTPRHGSVGGQNKFEIWKFGNFKNLKSGGVLNPGGCFSLRTRFLSLGAKNYLKNKIQGGALA